MKLRADDLRTDELVLELPAGEGAVNVLALGRSGGLSGVYEQDAKRIRLGELSADAFQLTRVSWTLPAGPVETEGTTRLGQVYVDATIALRRAEDEAPFVGTVRLGEAHFEAVVARLGDISVRLEDLRLDGVKARVGADGTVDAEASQASVNRVVVERGSMEVVFEEVQLPTGFALRGQDFALPRLRVDGARLRLDDLSELRTSNGREPPTEASHGGAVQDPLRLLDALHGKVDVDLRVDATVPLIGRRRATHHFRIPISNGTIDYHELERDLADLEDAFIDFAVRKGRLVLERDIPLLPFGSRTLVYWPLETAEDRTLAERRRARLALLAEPRVPAQRREEEVEPGKKGVVLRTLDFDNLDVDLSLLPAELRVASDGLVELGSPEEPAIRRLVVRGDVRYEPGQTLKPTELHIGAQDLLATLSRVPVGERRLHASAVRLGSIEDVALRFEGIQPLAAQAEIRALELEGLHLAPAE